MGHHDHLARARQPLEPQAHRVRHRAAHPLVHLVEDHHRPGGEGRPLPAPARQRSGQRRLQRQGEAREFAARGDGAQAAERRARVGRDLELHPVGPVAARALGGQRLHRHAEARALELQGSELGLHRGGQARARLAPGGGQVGGGDAIGGLCAHGGGVRFGQGVGGGVGRAQRFGEAQARGGQALHGQGQLAGGGAQGEQALLRAFQRHGLVVEGVRSGIDGGQRLQRFGQGAVHRVRGGGEAHQHGLVRPRPRLHHPIACALQRPQRLGDVVGQAVAPQHLARVGHVRQRLFRASQQRAATDQLLLLALARIEPVEFGQAQCQLLAVGVGAGGPGAQAFALGGGLAPGVPGVRAGAPARTQGAVAVELGPVGARVEQPHRVVLAVYLQEQGPEVAQHAHPRGLIVDEGAAAPVGGDLAAQHEVLAGFGVQALVGEVGVGGVADRRGEARHGARLGGPVTHEPRIRTCAGGQAQGVQHDGLSRPRLPRQRGEAGGGGQVQRLDQNDVANAEGGQHAPEVAVARARVKAGARRRRTIRRAWRGPAGPGA